MTTPDQLLFRHIDAMNDERFEAPPGFTRGFDPDFDSIVRSDCEYCGQSCDGLLETVRQFEKQHRMTCKHKEGGRSAVADSPGKTAP